jgi:TolB-like protein
LNGSVNNDLSRLKVNVVLTDLSTGRQIWADTHRAGLNPSQLIPFGEEVARAVAVKISAEYGIFAL